MLRIYLYFIFSFVMCFSSIDGATAQNDSIKPLNFSAYAEVYYSYDFSKPQNHLRPFFLYNFKRANEINLNLAYVKAAYKKENVRGNLAFMVGNYAQYNLASEPTWAQFVYEANIGVQLSKKNNWWLDVGIMPSHIGFESAEGAACWALTRSMAAENSPYYETGLKFSHTSKNNKWYTGFWLLNGWQHIQRPDGIQMPSIGMQVTYTPNENFNINYSNFLGTDKPDSLKAWRTYHDIYATYQLSKKWALLASIDILTDKYNTKQYGTIFNPMLHIQYKPNNKWRYTLRGEYYNDPKQIMISTNTTNGFKTFGTSFNMDYQLAKNVLWRIEGKIYESKDAIFMLNNQPSTNNYAITTSLAIKIP